MASNIINWDDFLSDQPKNKNITPTQETILDSPQKILQKAKELNIELYPIDIENVAKKIFNIEIRRENLGKAASGFLERINKTWYIYVNEYESVVRQRFTIAHELGHFILHKKDYINKTTIEYDQIFFRKNELTQKEKEANDFAGEILMPKENVYQAIKDGKNTVNKLAEFFQVSSSAARYRAFKLNLISSYY